uniref:Uncharacterized protein n=1 Tax=Anguilla anguilla TaxID=7936 RepID=A0A0E9PVM3_ANGAN
MLLLGLGLPLSMCIHLRLLMSLPVLWCHKVARQLLNSSTAIKAHDSYL